LLIALRLTRFSDLGRNECRNAGLAADLPGEDLFELPVREGVVSNPGVL
jgi:hypothetical protein